MCGSYFLPYVATLRPNDGFLSSMNQALNLKMDFTLDVFFGIFVNFEFDFLTHFREIFPYDTPTKHCKNKGKGSIGLNWEKNPC